MDSSLLFPILLVLLGGFMYLSIRRQKKRMAEVTDMQNSVGTGARVQLTSGLYGTVIDTNSDCVDVEIAPGVITRWNKLAVREVVATDDAAATYPGALVGEAAEQAEAPARPNLSKDVDPTADGTTHEITDAESDSAAEQPRDDK